MESTRTHTRGIVHARISAVIYNATLAIGAVNAKGTGNGHHLINVSATTAVYIEVGSRNPNDLTTCSDIDLKSSNADGRFVRKDGTSYP